MKKCYLFWLLLLAVSLKTYAQADLEAKAAYLLAEEKYGKGDMKAALQYLDDATAKLGTPIAKILYLKVMIQRDLANKDQRYLAKLDSTITLFQSSPDSKTFNEEKALEVMKIKLELKKELANIPVGKDTAAMATIGINAYESEHADWPLGASLETIRANHGNLIKSFSRVNNTQGNHYINMTVKSGISVFGFRNGRLFRYQEKHFDYKDDDLAHSKGKAAAVPVLEEFKKKFGYLPVPIIEDVAQNNVHSERYVWKNGNKSVYLLVAFSDFINKSGYSFCLSEIIDDSIK
jgi:hypothetical protein